MKSFKEFYITESKLERIESRFAKEFGGKIKIIDEGEGFGKLKKVLRDRIKYITYVVQSQKKDGETKKFLAAKRSDEDPDIKKGLAARNSKNLHASTIRDALKDVFGKEWNLLDVDSYAKNLNDFIGALVLDPPGKDATKEERLAFEESDKKIDMLCNHIESILTQKPTTLLGTNEKMQHSQTETAVVLKIGLPAFHSLFYDEEEKRWKGLITCPGAKDCIGLCFAASGMYVLQPNSSVKGTQIVNLLMNHPKEFKTQMIHEIGAEINKAKKLVGKVTAESNEKPIAKQLYIRIHDAGDFFSAVYFDIIMSIARTFPDVHFFAYTKSRDLVLAKQKTGNGIPENFTFNFSFGKTELKTNPIDRTAEKHSTIVYTEYFKDDQNLAKIKHGLVPSKKEMMMNDSDGLTSKQKWDALKSFLAIKFNLDQKKIYSYDEFMKNKDKLTSKDPIDVIVFPSDGDNSATTKTVRGTYLIEH